MNNIQEKSPIELIYNLFRDTGTAAKYRREIERRIGKKSFEVSLEDMTEFLNSRSQPSTFAFDPHAPLSLFMDDGSFRPFPREDFSKVGGWRIAETILKTDWEGCYTKTQDPYDSLVTLRRIRDRKLATEDDFDSHGHANLFRVIIGEFNKWASKKYAKEAHHA